MQEDYFLSLGGEDIFLNPKSFKVKDGRKLRELIDNVNAAHSPYKRFPRHPHETTQQYLKRFNEHLGLENVREEDESDEKYLSRVSKDTYQEDELERTYEMLRAIVAFVGQESKVNKDRFEESSLEEIDLFIKKVFKLCKIASA